MKRFAPLLALACVLAACTTPATPAPTITQSSSTTTSILPSTAGSSTTTVPATTTTVPPTTTLPSYPTGIEPMRIQIPSIGVDADVVDLSLAGPEPEVPSGFDDAGWYTATRNPGEIGPAVIAGHIDSRSGPAVFYRLDELKPGDDIILSSGDGRMRSFVVVDSGQYPKTDLPTEVFGFDQPVPELRLITCGGTFDSSVGHYRDNYVVYARHG
ncbi:MAG: class F sortase [Acidimicrobiia bacterium]